MFEALRKTTSALLDPDRRFRQARIFHATRVALALLASIALTTGIDIPHGEWATITVLVVIGGLQHHGNIRRRAAERGAGTLIGALIGFVLILQETWFGLPMLTWGLLALVCGYCAYHAVGKGGYLALLAAITVVITAGHGNQDVYDALWRTIDVLIGTMIALAFSFALPAYASYSWRFKLASLLRACAAVHAKIERGERDGKVRQQDMMKLSATLVQLRSLIPSCPRRPRCRWTIWRMCNTARGSASARWKCWRRSIPTWWAISATRSAISATCCWKWRPRLNPAMKRWCISIRRCRRRIPTIPPSDPARMLS